MINIYVSFGSDGIFFARFNNRRNNIKNELFFGVENRKSQKKKKK